MRRTPDIWNTPTKFLNKIKMSPSIFSVILTTRFWVEENGRAILNTGTWLKILKRIPVSFGYVPAVYYPTFRLNYFKIYEEKDKIAIEYTEVPKTPESELNILQRIFIIGKTPEPGKMYSAENFDFKN